MSYDLKKIKTAPYGTNQFTSDSGMKRASDIKKKFKLLGFKEIPSITGYLVNDIGEVVSCSTGKLKTGSTGERNGMSKINKYIANKIRNELLHLRVRTLIRNKKQHKLMEEYNLSQSQMWMILNNKVWV